MQLQAVHTVHMVDGKALPVSELQLNLIYSFTSPSFWLMLLLFGCHSHGPPTQPTSSFVIAQKDDRLDFEPPEMFRVNHSSLCVLLDLSAYSMVPAGP